MPEDHESLDHTSMYGNSTFNDRDEFGTDHVLVDAIDTLSLSENPALVHNDVASADRIQYLNKETTKVNTGLTFSQYGTVQVAGDIPQAPVNEVAETDADFSDLINSIAIPKPELTVERLVYILLHPPSHAFVYGVISFQWIIAVVGMEHIHFRSEDERYVLSKSSELRSRGAELGLPAVYLEWMCGNDPTTSATEQSMLLTPKFFEENRRD